MSLANTFPHPIGCQWPDLEREIISLDVWEDYYLWQSWVAPVSLAGGFLTHKVDLQSEFPLIHTMMMMMVTRMMNVLGAIYCAKFFY